MDKMFQQQFMSLVAGNSVFPENDTIIPCQNLTLSESLKIYQNNYHRNLQQSLSQTYEACATLTTEEIFEKLSFAFIQQHPPRQSDLALYGETFPQFLANSETIAASWPFLSELAELERLIKQLFLRGQNHVTMEIYYPVHQIWQSLLYDGENIDDFEGKKILSIHRDDSEQLFFELQETP